MSEGGWQVEKVEGRSVHLSGADLVDGTVRSVCGLRGGGFEGWGCLICCARSMTIVGFTGIGL